MAARRGKGKDTGEKISDRRRRMEQGQGELGVVNDMQHSVDPQGRRGLGYASAWAYLMQECAQAFERVVLHVVGAILQNTTGVKMVKHAAEGAGSVMHAEPRRTGARA